MNKALKKTAAIMIMVATIHVAMAQKEGVSIKTLQAPPDQSSMLDVESTNKGVLAPRVALVNVKDKAPIVNPAKSLLVYNTAISGTYPENVKPGFYFWDGQQWRRMIESDPGMSGGGVAPLESIIMWSGAFPDIPPGWQLCDGQRLDTLKNPESPLELPPYPDTYTTPNLSGKFIVGYQYHLPESIGETDYKSIGRKGGDNFKTMGDANMPLHDHAGLANVSGSLPITGNTLANTDLHTHKYVDNNMMQESNSGVRALTNASRENETKITTSSAGNHKHLIQGDYDVKGEVDLTLNSDGATKPIENRPPYYVLAYIIRVQ